MGGVSSHTSSSDLTFKNVSSEENHELLRTALNRLSPQLKKVIEVYFFQGFQGSAAAKKCGYSRSMLYQYLKIAKNRLRGLLSNKIV